MAPIQAPPIFMSESVLLFYKVKVFLGGKMNPRNWLILCGVILWSISLRTFAVETPVNNFVTIAEYGSGLCWFDAYDPSVIISIVPEDDFSEEMEKGLAIVEQKTGTYIETKTSEMIPELGIPSC